MQSETTLPGELLRPPRLYSASEVLARPSPVPALPGIYAWYFSEIPEGIDVTGCHSRDGKILLYLGISPSAPPKNGKAPSRSNIRRRLQTHYAGNASGSTLRLTLGCLLASKLGIGLRRVGSGGRYTFTNPGEQVLDTWLAANAFVGWHTCESPWQVEKMILSSGLPLPLNIADNPCAAHKAHLSPIRRAARVTADKLDVIADNGGARKGATRPIQATSA